MHTFLLDLCFSFYGYILTLFPMFFNQFSDANPPGFFWGFAFRTSLLDDSSKAFLLSYPESPFQDLTRFFPKFLDSFRLFCKKFVRWSDPLTSSNSEILKTAKDEYEYEPPNEYYRDGYNLYRRMEEKSEEHLRFLHDLRVPPTNNAAERDLRDFKRKQAQVMSFRSFKSLEAVCHSKSVLHLLRQKTENVYNAIVDIFL